MQEAAQAEPAQQQGPPVIRWGAQEGTPLRYADPDRLAQYVEEVDAEIQSGDDSLTPHYQEVRAELERRAKEAQS
ncbi:MAG: hypothetical protein ACODAG_12185 [Myxococcota bacterium]